MNRSRMTNTLRRLVRRFLVPRREYDEVVDALRLAYGHITRHHNCNIMNGLKLGGFCPVCHHEDGTDPEMEKIWAAIQKTNATLQGSPEAQRKEIP